MVVSRSARVALALHRFGGSTAAIDKHAGQIFLAMLDHVVAERACGFDIGRDSGGFYARPRSSTRGPARELRDLRLVCRRAIAGKISLEEWTKAWAAMPERTKRLWKPRLIETKQKERRRHGVWIRRAGICRDIDRSTLALGFAVAGFGMLAPKPQDMLSIIDRALAKISKNPGLKTRRRNAEAKAAVAAIKNAYNAISDGKRGKHVALGREIDGIFNTKLFAARSSTRLR